MITTLFEWNRNIFVPKYYSWVLLFWPLNILRFVGYSQTAKFNVIIFHYKDQLPIKTTHHRYTEW